jgi:hypothetical protein
LFIGSPDPAYYEPQSFRLNFPFALSKRQLSCCDVQF